MAGRSPDIGSGDLLNQAAARRRSAGRGEWAAGMRGRWAEGSRQARLACRAEAWRRLEGLCLHPKRRGKSPRTRPRFGAVPGKITRPIRSRWRVLPRRCGCARWRQPCPRSGKSSRTPDCAATESPGAPGRIHALPAPRTPLRRPSGAVVTRSPQPPRPIQSA